MTSYMVSNAMVLPISGWLANHFGRKRLRLTRVAGFTVPSLLMGIVFLLTLPFLPLLQYQRRPKVQLEASSEAMSADSAPSTAGRHESHIPPPAADEEEIPLVLD